MTVTGKIRALVCGLAMMAFTSAPLAAHDSAVSNAKVPAEIASAGVTTDLHIAAPLGSATTSPLLIQPVIPASPGRRVVERPRLSRAATNAWIALTVSQHSAALFDAWTTRKVIGSGKGYERDPLLRPFANSSAMYPATQVVPLALDFLGYRMMRSQNRFLRRGWWLPQAASIAGSLWCGSRNLNVANLRR